MKFLCLLSGHHRSTKRARPSSSYDWESICKYCREPMVRLQSGKWCLRSEINQQFKQDA